MNESKTIGNYPNTQIPRNAIMMGKYPGRVVGSYFASSAWLISEEAFKKVVGDSFGWWCFEDECIYKNSKRAVKPMNQKQWDKYKHLF